MKLTSKLGATLMGAALIAAASPLEVQLKEKDQEALGKEIRTYCDAYDKTEGVAEALRELGESIAKHNKKLSKKAKTDIDLLASPEDLAAMFALSKEYPKRSPSGKVNDFSADTFLGEPVQYELHAPKGYKASKGALPLILIVPDEGEKPEEHLNEDWTLGDLRNNAVIAALVMPKDPSLWSKRGGDVLGGR